ncbi:MAG: DsbA family protein [Candidatus Micrarchaeia archaeon]
MQSKKTDKGAKRESEPVFIVKPALKHYGLDYLHIALIVLVVVLVALAFSLATFKQAVLIKNCPYGIVNGTCASLQYTNAQVLQAAGRILASYSTVNTSLSLLPYYSMINDSTVNYMPNESEWLVVVPFKDPYISNTIFNFSMLLNANLSLEQAYLQAIKPVLYTNNSVVAPGVISIYGKTLCTTTKPIPLYLVVDPYAPGAMEAIRLAAQVSSIYNNSLNVSYDFVFGASAQQFYSQYGAQETQDMARYLFCAYRQRKMGAYAANLSSVFSGYPLSNSTLSSIASASKLNATQLDQCLGSSYTALAHQAQLANFYNVVSTPTFIANCKYTAIPQTLNNTITYALGEVK